MAKVRGLLIRSVVLDATALTAASQAHCDIRGVLRRWQDDGANLVTTAATLTEVLRGHARDAAIHRLLASLNVRVIDAPLGQAAGERIGRTKSRSNVTLDALVAEVASSLPRPVALLTSDVDDMQALVDADVMVLDIAA